MKVMRRHIIEPGETVSVALADTPNPEKSVLNAKFRLTSLPVLSDDDIARHKARRKKSKQMTNVETNDEAEETTGTRGREKKYELDLTAQGVSVSDETLTKDQKDDAGKVVKTHSITSKEIKVTDLNGALGLFGADEAALFAFLSEASTAYYQRTDRQRLNALAQGPQKNMERAIKALVAGGIPEASARELVEAKFKSEGLL